MNNYLRYFLVLSTVRLFEIQLIFCEVQLDQAAKSNLVILNSQLF